MICWTAQLRSRPLQRRVAQRQVARQQLAPALDLGQELVVHLRGAALAGLGLRELVERTLPHRGLAEHAGDLVPAGGVLLVVQQEDAARGGLVRRRGLGAAVVDGQLLEIGEDREGQLGAPRVAAELVRGIDLVLDVHRGLLGLDEELALLAEAEGVVRRLGRVADLHLVLVDHLFVLLREALRVVDVPAERGEEGVDELVAGRDLAERGGVVLVVVAFEELDELDDLGGSNHR